MPSHSKSRRDFLKTSIASAAVLPIARSASARAAAQEAAPRPSRIRFAAIGLNHGHIYGQVEAVTRGGGELVSFYAKEPDLVERIQQAVSRRRSSRAARRRSSRIRPSSWS